MSEIAELIGEKLNGQTLSSIMWSLEKKIGSRITDLEQAGRLVNRELFGQVFSGKNGDKYRFAGIEKANSKKEAYSAAGKTWFGWWLVEHYFSYHIDCPDGCDSGEPARGRKDPPYFQMSYGSLDNIPDLVDPLVESPLPVQ